MFLFISYVAYANSSLPKVVHSHSYPLDYEEYVTKYADEFGIDKYLVFAFINVESGFDKDAVSSQNAIGLTQITEETFVWLKNRLEPGSETVFEDLFDPETSIKYGAYYISRCMDRYSQDVSTRAAAYHSGWTTVDILLEEYGTETLQQFPYTQMNNYVKKINNAYKAYLDKYNR